MAISEGGRSLPLGIRRRIALARALMNTGRLAVFDDPTEALDAEGCQAVYMVLNALARAGLTLVVATADPSIIKGAGYVLDMNEKPTPRLSVSTPAASSRQAAPPSQTSPAAPTAPISSGMSSGLLKPSNAEEA